MLLFEEIIVYLTDRVVFFFLLSLFVLISVNGEIQEGYLMDSPTIIVQDRRENQWSWVLQ